MGAQKKSLRRNLSFGFRPIAGYVNICPNALREIEEHGDAHWLATIKHELLHVFAFSTSLYPSFVGARKRCVQPRSFHLICLNMCGRQFC